MFWLCNYVIFVGFCVSVRKIIYGFFLCVCFVVELCDRLNDGWYWR